MASEVMPVKVTVEPNVESPAKGPCTTPRRSPSMAKPSAYSIDVILGNKPCTQSPRDSPSNTESKSDSRRQIDMHTPTSPESDSMSPLTDEGTPPNEFIGASLRKDSADEPQRRSDSGSPVSDGSPLLNDSSVMIKDGEDQKLIESNSEQDGGTRRSHAKCAEAEPPSPRTNFIS
ncbi:uncharacterized protein [Ptychodera flava]|uniref:uncharacterized protein n=1 Tax=Ptychodera flava TaxID=63121 RepID=UPI00396A7282